MPGLDDAGRVIDEGDAGEAVDAGTPDAGLWCTTGGLPGTCLDVALCTGTRSSTAGLCPGASNIQCCTPRYANACDPNEVQQPNTHPAESPADGGCLPGLVRVTTFCVDEYEASLLEVLDARRHAPLVAVREPGHPRAARAVGRPRRDALGLLDGVPLLR